MMKTIKGARRFFKSHNANFEGFLDMIPFDTDNICVEDYYGPKDNIIALRLGYPADGSGLYTRFTCSIYLHNEDE